MSSTSQEFLYKSQRQIFRKNVNIQKIFSKMKIVFEKKKKNCGIAASDGVVR
jgi:hypothetical protein